MASLALDQVAHDIVGNPRAQTTNCLARLHQRHCVVELRRGRWQLRGQRVEVRAEQKRRLEAGGKCLEVMAFALLWRMSGGEDVAVSVDHEQLGDFWHVAPRLFEAFGVGRGPGVCQGAGDQLQGLPVLVGPGFEELDAAFGQAAEGLFDLRAQPCIEQAGPAHGQLAGFAEPRQPASFAAMKIHFVTV